MARLPRKYQTETIDSVMSLVKPDVQNNLLAILATGAGKTVISTMISDKFKRTLFIVDSEELLEQAGLSFIKEKFDDSFYNYVKELGYLNYVKQGPLFAAGSFKMGAIKADVFEPNGQVVIASIQTLYRRLHLLKPDDFELVIVDEAHAYLAKTYFKGVTYFTPKLRLGLTATAVRADGLPLIDLFDKVAYEWNIIDGVRDGYLAELDAIRVKTNVDLDKVHTMAGEFNQNELSNEINTLARNNLVLDSYLKYADGRQAIGFACDIKHAVDLTEVFIQRGIVAAAVSSNEEITGDREKTIRLFKEGKIQVLFNVTILGKGFDSPEVSCIIMARPTKSLTLYLQAIGRGTRLLPGTIDGIDDKEERLAAIKKSKKTNCLIIDIVDNTSKHSLVNAWELDKQKPVEERTFVSEEKKKLLLEEREKKTRSVQITHSRKEDERVNLLAIPKVDIGKFGGLQKEASPAQLSAIAKWGYDIVNVNYTMEQIAQIFNSQPVSQKQLSLLKYKGYDISNGCSIAEFKKAMAEIEKKEQQALISKYTPSNDGKPFF